ncbi:MAG: hypothetical protein NTX56_02785 [Proteobacteria bacterium]|nr:hypothetical protein [Pseudomonadota bacterium]
MNTYALIDNADAVLRSMHADSLPESPNPIKGLTWLPMTETWPTLGSGQKIGNFIYVVDRVGGTVTKEHQAIDKTAEEIRADRKTERTAAVEMIRVTVGGKVFDGDETSQTRMARAIIALQATGTPSVTWVLADNTPTLATVAELSEALALAGAEQAAIWVIE